jgi:pyruvate,water dikinase
MKQQRLIKKLKAGLTSDETGNKANSLIFLHKYGFNIPLTFLVSTVAYERYLKEGPGILEEIKNEVKSLPDVMYAVRSSTSAEDSQDFTYAGQFQTMINIRGTDDIVKAIREVWDSVHLINNSEYLRRTRITSIKCGVIIQEMIPSVLAGVSFSSNPVTNQDEVVIEAVEGMGQDLVQKGLTPIRWRIFNDQILEGNRNDPNFEIIRKVGKDTLKLKRYYGHHIDIEWVYDGSRIYYLQLRKITGKTDIQVYSNKLAKEMLPGQIKPLVWSVNIPMVNGTWIGLLSEITGTLDVKPEDLARPFYYQTYFNNVALGKIFNEFGMSADSLEQMMIKNDRSKPSFRPGIKIIRHTFRIIRFIYNKLTFEKTFIREYNELNAKYLQISQRLKNEFSLKSYPEIFSELFTEGKKLTYLNIVIPLLNQIYNKSLKKKLSQNNLDYDNLDFNRDFPQLVALSPMHSIEKIRRSIDELPDQIRNESVSFSRFRSFPETGTIVDAIDDFLKEFGHLSDSGNDFSFPKWEEDPEMVFNMILKSVPLKIKTGLFSLKDMPRTGVKVSAALIRKYNKAGRFKVYREQISSLFIFGVGLFRRLFLDLGREISKYGIINAAEDIFYLKKNEIDRIIQDILSSAPVPYHGIIRERRKEMEDTKDYSLPPVIYGEEAPILELNKKRNHHGLGTSPGVFSGKTRVIRQTRDFESFCRGDVLIIPFSDVSWTPILIQAGAIVSETGGLLSHCSIIAREMGIPAMVSVANACSLGDGLNVTVDGSNGILTIHDYE